MRPRTPLYATDRSRRIGTIDAAGRLSLGAIDAALGPDLRFAAAFATKHRLIVRFLDTPDAPAGWVSVPVIRKVGRYPHLRLTGPRLRPLRRLAGLDCRVAVHIAMSVESRQIALWRIR